MITTSYLSDLADGGHVGREADAAREGYCPRIVRRSDFAVAKTLGDKRFGPLPNHQTPNSLNTLSVE